MRAQGYVFIKIEFQLHIHGPTCSCLMLEYLRSLNLSTEDVVEKMLEFGSTTQLVGDVEIISRAVREGDDTFSFRKRTYELPLAKFQAVLDALIAETKFDAHADEEIYKFLLKLRTRTPRVTYEIVHNDRYRSTQYANIPWSILPRTVLLEIGNFMPLIACVNLEILSSRNRFFVVNGKVQHGVTDEVFANCERVLITEHKKSCWWVLKCVLTAQHWDDSTLTASDYSYIGEIMNGLHARFGK